MNTTTRAFLTALTVICLLGIFPATAMADQRAENTEELKINILSPNGGEVWENGGTYTIEWEQNNIDKVAMYLQRGSTGYTICDHTVDINAESGSYDFTVPKHIPEGSNYKIWVIAYKTGYGQVKDYSDNCFSVEKQTDDTPAITILSPNGGEVWENGGTYTIEWEQKNIDKVAMYLQRGSTGYTICDHTVDINAEFGSYNFTVPKHIPEGSNYKIWVIAYKTGYGQVKDYSDDYFSVEAVAVADPPVLSWIEPRDIVTVFDLGEEKTVGGIRTPVCPYLVETSTDRKNWTEVPYYTVTAQEGLREGWSEILFGEPLTAHYIKTSERRSPSVFVEIAILGDFNGDGIVCRDDLNILLEYKNQPASVFPEGDLDGDGMITGLDARKLMLLCTNPRCA